MRAFVGVLAGVTLALALSAPAQASTTFYPSSSNGFKIYLSKACHDRGTGACQPNYGCGGYNENVGSGRIINAALTGANYSSSGLLDRGYTVRIGDQLTQQNINDSNNFRPKIHIPVHSNAAGTSSCGSSVAGTWGLYKTTNGKAVGQAFLDTVGRSSPGTSERLSYRDDLGEINSVTAVTGYLEAGFHTNQTETNWLNNYANWGWYIGYGVDLCLGYPRAGSPRSGQTCPF